MGTQWITPFISLLVFKPFSVAAPATATPPLPSHHTPLLCSTLPDHDQSVNEPILTPNHFSGFCQIIQIQICSFARYIFVREYLHMSYGKKKRVYRSD